MTNAPQPNQPGPSERSTWDRILAEFALLLGVAFILYGFLVCVLSYFPTVQQRGTLISLALPWLNIAAVLMGFYFTLAMTYLPPNPRPATPAAKRIYAPLLLSSPIVLLLVRYVWGVWPSADMLLGITLITIGVSVLRTLLRS